MTARGQRLEAEDVDRRPVERQHVSGAAPLDHIGRGEPGRNADT